MSRSALRAYAAVAAACAVMVLAWIIALPPSSGPDEPSHIVRGAALVRGELDGERIAGTPQFLFELPAWIGFPDPGCYAFDPTASAACATTFDAPPGSALLATRSSDYPIWGHVLPGLATLGPDAFGQRLIRIFDALLPILLVAATALVALRRSRLAAAGVLLALTPMAWFSFAVVNPSGLVVAGGAATWVALLTLGGAGPAAAHARTAGDQARTSVGGHAASGAGWLLAAGTAATVLPRRDGMVWAALIVATAIIINDVGPGVLLRRLTRPQLGVIAAAGAATALWAITADASSTLALAGTIAAPLAAVGVRRAWRHPELASRARRVGFMAALVGVAGVGALFVMAQRSSGFDRAVLRGAVSQTGIDLREAIGILGWLDAPLFETTLLLWVVLLGVLVGATLVLGRYRAMATVGGVFGIALVASWTLTMLQNDADGRYWQGRYYLPLLVGIPIVLCWSLVGDARGRSESGTGGDAALGSAADRNPQFASSTSDVLDRLALVLGAGAVLVVNLALASTMRRFAVGIGGSYVPLDWDTYGAPVPPVVLLVVHAAASVALVALVATKAGLSGGLLGAGLSSTGAASGAGGHSHSDSAADPGHDSENGLGADARHRGVNIVGYHHVSSGLGEIARELCASLDAAGVPNVAVDVVGTASPEQRPPADEPEPEALFATTIAVVTAPQLPSALDALPSVRAATDELVGYWFYELDTVPADHGYAAGLVDRIWTPTRFVHDAYAHFVRHELEHAAGGQSVDRGRRPLVELQPTRLVEPHVDAASVARWRERWGSSHVFLTSFDMFSVIERKHPLGTIEAFLRAFGDSDADVRLVVKTINGDRRIDDLKRVAAAARRDARIELIDRHVTADDLTGMIAAADTFVSLHRSEGLGLHLATAMWAGTPVIATQYSGNLDFMADGEAALVPADLVLVTDGRGAYPSTAHWADPDLDQAAAWMRRLVTEPDTAASLAAAARQRLEAQPSRAEIGGAIAARLGLTAAAANTDNGVGSTTVATTISAAVPEVGGDPLVP